MGRSGAEALFFYLLDFITIYLQLLILELVWKRKRRVTELEVTFGLVLIFFNPLALIVPSI